MRSSDMLAPLFLAATTLAQAVPEGIAPASKPPPGCEPNSSSDFTIGTLKVGNKKSSKRDTAAADGALVCNLNKGILRDSLGRTGSVVANHQFQFDGPPQAGAIYTGGFSICNNGSLAIGGTTRWWQCSSGPFYNLYDEWIGEQCEEIRIQVAMTGDHEVAVPSASGSASASADASVSTEVASVQSTRATISGAVSTVSETAVGPTASFMSSNMSATATDSMSISMSEPTMSGTATMSPSPSSSESGSPDAPEAGGAAPASFGVAKGSMLGAFVVIFGAALVL